MSVASGTTPPFSSGHTKHTAKTTVKTIPKSLFWIIHSQFSLIPLIFFFFLFLPSICIASTPVTLVMSDVVVQKSKVSSNGFADEKMKLKKGLVIKKGIDYLSTKENLESILKDQTQLHGLLMDFGETCTSSDIRTEAPEVINIAPVIDVSSKSLSLCDLNQKITIAQTTQVKAKRSFYIFVGSHEEFPTHIDFKKEYNINAIFIDTHSFKHLRSEMDRSEFKLSNTRTVWTTAWPGDYRFVAFEVRLSEGSRKGHHISRPLLIVIICTIVFVFLGLIITFRICYKRRKRAIRSMQLSNRFKTLHKYNNNHKKSSNYPVGDSAADAGRPGSHDDDWDSDFSMLDDEIPKPPSAAHLSQNNTLHRLNSSVPKDKSSIIPSISVDNSSIGTGNNNNVTSTTQGGSTHSSEVLIKTKRLSELDAIPNVLSMAMMNRGHKNSLDATSRHHRGFLTPQTSNKDADWNRHFIQNPIPSGLPTGMKQNPHDVHPIGTNGSAKPQTAKNDGWTLKSGVWFQHMPSISSVTPRLSNSSPPKYHDLSRASSFVTNAEFPKPYLPEESDLDNMSEMRVW